MEYIQCTFTLKTFWIQRYKVKYILAWQWDIDIQISFNCRAVSLSIFPICSLIYMNEQSLCFPSTNIAIPKLHKLGLFNSKCIIFKMFLDVSSPLFSLQWRSQMEITFAHTLLQSRLFNNECVGALFILP